ncbi:MAG: serine hydrolase domain-containing protein [Candidatus Cyclobacteriaceae bacterium M3_2C_046]
MKKKQSKKLIYTALFVGSLLLLFGNYPYLAETLIYTTPNIDDYQIFCNRSVPANQFSPWKIRKGGITNLPVQYRDAIEDLEPVAFLVVQDQEILYEEYWDGYDENSYSNSFSMAKSIVGLCIGAAIDQGYIKSIDQKVGDFLPEYRLKDNNQLTIRHLLTMSSGLNWNESYWNPFSVTTQAYYGDNLEELVLDLQVVDQPGQEFKYLSGNTLVLAVLLKHATGMNLSDFASKFIWQPIGAKNNALWSLDHEDGMEKAYCCFNSNARDFARIGQMLLDSGRWEGKQVISSQFIHEALQPARNLKDEDNKSVNFYGYQFWIVHHKNMTIPYARGILGQYIFVIPEKQAVVVRLGHKRASDKQGEHPEDVFLYLNTALEMLN